MRTLNIAALALVIVGALNWGLVSIAKFDLVAAVFGLEFGETSIATRIVYGLVGLAAVPVAVNAFGRRQQATARPAHRDAGRDLAKAA
jgi:uncharacterized membrane protein YuzA (DUF378 family)